MDNQMPQQQIQVQPELPQPSQNIIPISSNKKKLTLILGTIILLLAISGISYYFGSQNSNKPIDNDKIVVVSVSPTESLPTSIPTVSPTPILTTWETYQSPSGISFSYPKLPNYSLNVGKTPEISTKDIGPEDFFTLYTNKNGISSGIFFFQILTLDNKNWDQFIESYRKSLDEMYYMNYGTKISNGTESKIIIDGREGFNFGNYSDSNSEDIYVLFPDKKRVLYINKSGETDKTHPTIFPKILSSIKFIN